MNSYMNNEQAAHVFKALGDPTCFKLVQKLLEDRNICVSELAEVVDISVAGVSQQLKILEQAHVIQRVRNGQRICYQINREDPLVGQIIHIISPELASAY